jgi:Uma2 family endonuclease
MATSIRTSSVTDAAAAVGITEQAIPRLEQGDRLSRVEFERRFAAMPHLKKAELIEGAVYMQAPVSIGHSDGHFHMVGWLHAYVMATPSVHGGDNLTVRIDEHNQVQPDGFLRLPLAGRSRASEDGYLDGPPELIVEVASSSVSYDLHDKLNVYRRSGVAEYLVWRVLDQDFDWFILRDGQYQMLVQQDGILKSEVFPGLWLDKPALLAGDLAKVMAVLGQGLTDPLHAAFVERLQGSSEKT